MESIASFYVAADRRSISIGRKNPVIIALGRPVPKHCEVRSFRLVEKRSKRRETTNWRADNVRYEAHITVEITAAAPAPAPKNLSEVVGVRMGVRNTWTTSEGHTYRNDGPRACNCRPKRVGKENGMGNQLVHDHSCPHRAAQVLGDEIIAKPGGTRRPPHRVSKRRRHKEVQRRELLRKRTADRDRVFHEHAQAILDQNGVVRAVAVPRLSLGRMLRSGRGTPEHPGTQVAARTEMNRRLANAALGQNGSILGSQAGKRGIQLTAVPGQDSALTCSQCGHRNPRPTGSRRRTQLFLCEACAHQETKDTNQASVLAQRAFESLTNTPPKSEAKQDRTTAGRRRLEESVPSKTDPAKTKQDAHPRAGQLGQGSRRPSGIDGAKGQLATLSRRNPGSRKGARNLQRCGTRYSRPAGNTRVRSKEAQALNQL